MRKAAVLLIIPLVILALGITAQEALTAEKTNQSDPVLVFVNRCPGGDPKVECATHQVKKGEYLLLIAKQYNVSLSAILDLPQNKNLKERKIPVRLAAYFHDPWDLIYPKENITLPLVYAKDVKTAELEKKVGSLEQTLTKERGERTAEKSLLLGWAIGVSFLFVATCVVLFLVLKYYRQRPAEV